MTDPLVIEARAVAKLWRSSGLTHGVETLLDRLADALERVTDG